MLALEHGDEGAGCHSPGPAPPWSRRRPPPAFPAPASGGRCRHALSDRPVCQEMRACAAPCRSSWPIGPACGCRRDRPTGPAPAARNRASAGSSSAPAACGWSRISSRIIDHAPAARVPRFAVPGGHALHGQQRADAASARGAEGRPAQAGPVDAVARVRPCERSPCGQPEESTPPERAARPIAGRRHDRDQARRAPATARARGGAWRCRAARHHHVARRWRADRAGNAPGRDRAGERAESALA